MIQKIKHYSKPVFAFFAIIAFRQIPVRPPNVEPILGTIMPMSKSYGVLSGIIFSVLSIVFHDFLTFGIGSHTWSASLAYALVALGSGMYLANRDLSTKNLLKTTTIGIIFYDVMTGVVLGPLFTSGSFYMALIGQIPFTALHLMGGALFAMTLSPVLSKWFESETAKVAKVSNVCVLQ